MARTLLISDLHLGAARPATHELFLRFLEEHAPGAAALYILGDLFEAWIGDDDLEEPFNASVVHALARASAGGTPVYVMRGNRDFLLGERFCARAGTRLLEEPSVLEIEGLPTLLMHGDTLCTGDHGYQAWRRTARSGAWQQEFLGKPLAQRRRLAAELREKSRREVSAKPPEIMDVAADAVHEAFRRFGVARMIHGHTHRPARHELVVDGRRCERWVLPDWYGPGGYLCLDASGARLIGF